jgi:hypothetical protein
VKIILKWILVNRVQGSGLDSSGSGQVLVVGFCEHGNEPQGPIQDELCSREFVGKLHNKILDDERNRSAWSGQQPDGEPEPVCSSHAEQARIQLSVTVIVILRAVTPCGLVDSCYRYVRKCHVHLQGASKLQITHYDHTYLQYTGTTTNKRSETPKN